MWALVILNCVMVGQLNYDNSLVPRCSSTIKEYFRTESDCKKSMVRDITYSDKIWSNDNKTVTVKSYTLPSACLNTRGNGSSEQTYDLVWRKK